jgi:hypothetical protein
MIDDNHGFFKLRSLPDDCNGLRFLKSFSRQKTSVVAEAIEEKCAGGIPGGGR